MSIQSGLLSVVLIFLSPRVFAESGIHGSLLAQGNQNGGNGLAGQAGKRGLDGCPGGTHPASDGQFYLPDTRQPCNPSESDRKTHPQDGRQQQS